MDFFADRGIFKNLINVPARLTSECRVITSLGYDRMKIRYNLSRKDPPMKVKKYILIITIVLTFGLSYAGATFACNGGSPPPDTASVQVDSPAI